MSQTVVLYSPDRRRIAAQLIEKAPRNAVVTIKPAKRTTDQNAKMWAMLSDISRAKPEGRTHTPEVWKSLFMSALGYEVAFVMGLDGNPFPTGFRTSRLSVQQMSDLIEFMHEYAARHSIRLNEPEAA